MVRIYRCIKNKLDVVDWQYYGPLVTTYLFPIIFLYLQYEVNVNTNVETEWRVAIDSIVQTTIAYLVGCAWKYANNLSMNKENRCFLMALGLFFICYMGIYCVSMAYIDSNRLLIFVIIKTLLLLIINYFSYLEWKEVGNVTDDPHRKLSAEGDE